MNTADPLAQLTIGEVTLGWRAMPPRVEALAAHANDSAQQPDRELRGHSFSTSRNPVTADRSPWRRKPLPASSPRVPGAAPCFRARAPAAALAPPTQIGALTPVSFVLSLPVMQRLLRTAQLRRQLLRRPCATTQQLHGLTLELRRIRRSRPRHHTRSSPGPTPESITVSTRPGQLHQQQGT